jgi:hypothetical protein
MTSLQSKLTILHSCEKKASGKSLALPTGSQPPNFDQVVQTILAGIMCDLSVGVLCLTQAALDEWLDWPGRLSPSLARFDVLECDQATLSDWQTFLSSRSYDLTVLHGVCAELQAGRLAAFYVTALIDAVPAGMVVIA